MVRPTKIKRYQQKNLISYKKCLVLGMRDVEPPFEMAFEGKNVSVSEHQISDKRVFHIEFSAGQKPLNITVAFDRKDQKFWTSVPEGRQMEAEQLGRLIAAYIRSKKK